MIQFPRKRTWKPSEEARERKRQQERERWRNDPAIRERKRQKWFNDPLYRAKQLARKGKGTEVKIVVEKMKDGIGLSFAESAADKPKVVVLKEAEIHALMQIVQAALKADRFKFEYQQ